MFTVSKEKNFLTINDFDGRTKSFILDINEAALLSARTKKPYVGTTQKTLMEQVNKACQSYLKSNPNFTTIQLNGLPFRFHEDDATNLLFVLSFFHTCNYGDELEDLYTITQWIFSNKKENWNIGQVSQMVRGAKRYGLSLNKTFFKLLLENEEYFQMEGYNYYRYSKRNNLDYKVENLLLDYALSQKPYKNFLPDLSLDEKRVLIGLEKRDFPLDYVSYIARKMVHENIFEVFQWDRIVKHYDLAINLGIDPKGRCFSVQHCLLLKLARERKQELDKKRFQKAVSSAYNWEDENYYYLPPQNPNELILAGERLNNCLGSYADRIRRLYSGIVLIYKKEGDGLIAALELNRSQYKGDRIVLGQALTYNNRRIAHETLNNSIANYYEYINQKEVKEKIPLK